MSWLSSATGIHLNSGRVTKPSLKSLAKLGGVTLGASLIPGVGGFLGGLAGKAAGMLGGGGDASTVNPGSVGPGGIGESGGISSVPTTAAGGGAGMGSIRSWLQNPLVLGAGAEGLNRLLNKDQYNQARDMNSMELEILRRSLEAQRQKQAQLAPLQAGAASTLSGLMQSGSGSILSPEGRTPYKLPAYTPGSNVNLGMFRGGSRSVRPFLLSAGRG